VASKQAASKRLQALLTTGLWTATSFERMLPGILRLALGKSWRSSVCTVSRPASRRGETGAAGDAAARGAAGQAGGAGRAPGLTSFRMKSFPGERAVRAPLLFGPETGSRSAAPG
jgi:hypothetical protein